MPHLNSCVLRLMIWASINGLAAPVLAHKVKISNQIGATLHIEPDDQARTHQPTVIWFALTKKGGQVVPLSQCQCQLQIFKLPSKKAVMQPPLQSINAEKYQGIPSTTVLFQQPGTYLLELSGRPLVGTNFQPFKLRFDLIVVPGRATPKTAVKP
jgi:hypothetical protein